MFLSFGAPSRGAVCCREFLAARRAARFVVGSFWRLTARRGLLPGVFGGSPRGAVCCREFSAAHRAARLGEKLCSPAAVRILLLRVSGFWPVVRRVVPGCCSKLSVFWRSGTMPHSRLNLPQIVFHGIIEEAVEG
jgi:hypothetical protein